MPWPWGRIVEAVRALLERQPDPSPADISPEARAELERWDAEDVARYNAEQDAGERDAPDDAEHIDPDGI